MANEDVLIKVAADINQAVQALNILVAQMGDVVKAVSDTNTAAAEGEESAKSFWETWLTGANQTGAAAVAWGEQMSKAFDLLKTGVKDAITSLPNLVRNSAALGDELWTMGNRLDTTAARLGELKYIAAQSGASMEAMARTSQTLTMTLNDAGSNGAKAIERLGLSVKELAAKDKTEAMFEIIKRIQDVVPAAQQSAKMMEVFGGKARMLTMLLKEDLDGLRQSYKELGNSADELNKLAKEGDRFSDNLENIRTVQQAWRNDIANALLPTINEFLETMPGLGGAVLTLGEGFMSTAQSMLPLLGNIALLKSSGLAATVVSWAAALPGATFAMNAAAVAARGLTAALGPLGIAIAGVSAAWIVWKKANEESGWIRQISDRFQHAGLILQGYSHAEAEAMIATDHATQRAREAAEALKAQGEETKKTGEAAKTQASGMAQLAAQTKAVNDAFASLTAAQKATIKASLEAGGSTKDIAELLAGEMNVSADIAERAIDKFNKSLSGTKKESAAAKTELQKFAEEAKTIATSISQAVKANAPMAVVLEEFGKSAADAVQKAELIPGALAKVPPEVIKIAAAWNSAQLSEKMAKLIEQAVALGKAFSEKVAAGASSAAAAIKKMAQDMTLSMLSGSEKRLKQIEFEEAAALESIQKQSEALDEALEDQLAKIKQNFAERRRAEAAAGTASPARLAQIAAEEAAAIASAEAQAAAAQESYAQQYDTAQAYYDQKRALEQKSTGDFEKDAELRGLKTKAVYAEELKAQEDTLAFMKANRDQFTDEQIKKQEQAVQAAKVAAGVAAAAVKVDWQGALDSITRAFEQLATISGATFGGMLKDIGQVIGSFNLMAKGLSSAFSEKGFGGIGAAFTAAKGAGTGFMGMLNGVIGSLPAIGTAISGIMSAVSGAIALGKKLWDAFTQSGGEKAAKDVGRDWGVKISEEMGNTFYKTAKELFRGDRFAATLYHMSDIVKEAGGITAKNFTQMLRHLRDVFSMVEKGTFTVEQAAKVLDENFGAFADHVLKSGKVASQQFVEIIKLNARFGTQSKQIMDFVAGQTSRLGSALASLAGAQNQTNESMERFERLAMAGFNAAIAAGVPYLDALEQMGPAIDKIVEHNKRLGREGGAAIQELLRFREIATANKEVVESAAALNEVMLALSNTGALNAETMADLQTQGMDTFNQLTAAGFTEQQALQQMKGFLEQVRNAHRELGLPIDENTQKLIDQAEAQGVLKAEQMSTNDIMLEGLSAIIEALGGKIPEAFKKAKIAGTDAAQGLRKTTDETTQAIEHQADTLTKVPWTQYADRSIYANKVAYGALQNVNSGIRSVDEMLARTDWAGWSEEAVDAAKNAQDAVDSVSFGSSPGGIKEIALQLNTAIRAFRTFETASVDSALSVKDVLDVMLSNADWSGWSNDAVTAAETAQAAIDQVTFDVQPGNIGAVAVQLTDAMRTAEDVGVRSAMSIKEALDSITLSTDWTGWAEDANAAARTVQVAIDDVSFDIAPTNITDVAGQLTDAIRTVEAVGVKSVQSMKDAVDTLTIGEPDWSGWFDGATDAARLAQTAIDAVSFDLEPDRLAAQLTETMDAFETLGTRSAASVKEAVDAIALGENPDWSGWFEGATDAARIAQTAIDSVSFDVAPDDIAAQMTDAMDAFETLGTQSAASVKTAVDAIVLETPDWSGWFAGASKGATLAQDAIDQVSFDLAPEQITEQLTDAIQTFEREGVRSVLSVQEAVESIALNAPDWTGWVEGASQAATIAQEAISSVSFELSPDSVTAPLATAMTAFEDIGLESVASVKNAVETIRLQDADWSGWFDGATSAAAAAQTALDSVSLDVSPEAVAKPLSDAMRTFEEVGMTSALSVKNVVESITLGGADWSGWFEGAAAAAATAQDAIDSVAFELSPDSLADPLIEAMRTFEEIGLRSAQSVQQAVGSVAKAGPDWTGWSEEAIDAAKTAQDALGDVSLELPSSNVTDIAKQLQDAMRAVQRFEDSDRRATVSMKDAVGAITVNQPDLEQATVVATEHAAKREAMATTLPERPDAQMQQLLQAVAEAMKTSQVNLTFQPTVINPDGLRRAVEDDILPSIIEAVNRNNRGSLTKLRLLINT